MHSIVLALGRDQPRRSLAHSLPGGPQAPHFTVRAGKEQRCQRHQVTIGGPGLVTSARGLTAFLAKASVRRSVFGGRSIETSCPW